MKTNSAAVWRCLALVAVLADIPINAFAAADAVKPPTAEKANGGLRINGPSVFGVRPGHPLIHRVPVTGERPIKFAASGLPDGAAIDPASGVISGIVAKTGEYPMVLTVRNDRGSVERKFTLKVGESICLTPPMGWNSWNCWAETVSAEKVLQSARAMAQSGLADHGWTFINIDDSWQGKRGGAGQALSSNEKFPDMRGLCAAVHALGLKIGLYSTPWVTSYAGFPGGSSDAREGTWVANTANDPRAKNWRHGAFTFEIEDARRWAQWGVDYLKYDWSPMDVPHARAMFEALRNSGRDIVLSLSNSASLDQAAEWPKVANAWRTTNDIGDEWAYTGKESETWRYGVSEIAFCQDPWVPFAGPGHWNDPDMLVVGKVGWGPALHDTHLSRDEQYSHISMWCMLSAPLLIGCPLDQLDDFTLALLSNDDVLAIDQDALGVQARRVATVGAVDVYQKPLEDGSIALAFFNRGAESTRLHFNKLGRIGINGEWHGRDLWKQQDLGVIKDQVSTEIPGHGVWLLRLSR
ncbi:MAG: putative Ig domain-containing protein [Opitutus sp.]